MSNHINVDETSVQAIIEGAEWKVGGCTLSEKKASGAKKGDKPAKGKKGDKPDFTTGARKGDEDEEGTGKDFEKETHCEAVEEHSCPLCESVLAEELSDERILEHIEALEEAIRLLAEEAALEEGDNGDNGDDDEEEGTGTRASKKTQAAATRASEKVAAMKEKYATKG